MVKIKRYSSMFGREIKDSDEDIRDSLEKNYNKDTETYKVVHATTTQSRRTVTFSSLRDAVDFLSRRSSEDKKYYIIEHKTTIRVMSDKEIDLLVSTKKYNI